MKMLNVQLDANGNVDSIECYNDGGEPIDPQTMTEDYEDENVAVSIFCLNTQITFQTFTNHGAILARMFASSMRGTEDTSWRQN